MKGRIDSVSRFNTFPIHRLPESGFCTDATEEDICQGQGQMIKMGLMRYLAKTPLFKDFNISFNKNEESKPVEDKWKCWVFNI